MEDFQIILIELKILPGVGDYTASAICAIVFNNQLFH